MDKTKHGDYIISDMKEAVVTNPQGISFTQDANQEIAQLIKQKMIEKGYFLY